MKPSIPLKFSIRLERTEFVLDAAHTLSFQGIAALYGQNGSGKSTLLRVLAGLEPSAEGHISFGDQIWQSGPPQTMMPAHLRGIGFVFQEPRLFPHLNVAGNLAYAETRAARAIATNGGQPIRREPVIEALDLATLLDRSPAALSGGERQRVALGRALLANPRLMLMDEPLSAIDNRRRHEILNYIARLHSIFGIPTLYVTHALDEVVRLADHMLVLSNGGISASGPVEEILERLDLAPATGRFEAGVLLRARVKSHDPAYQLTALEHQGAPAHQLWVPLVDAAPGAEVRLRIRARDVTLATIEPRGVSTRNILPGTLVEINPEPDTAFTETLVDIGGARLRARLTRKAADELDLKLGSKVYALIKSISLDRIVPRE